jgi:hypothetical protein
MLVMMEQKALPTCGVVATKSSKCNYSHAMGLYTPAQNRHGGKLLVPQHHQYT